MGFRQGAFATVWEINPASDVRTNARITISKKDKQTGGYTQEFSGFVSFLGTAAAKKAAALNVRDRIKLGEIDVTNKYDKEKKVTYTNFNIFSFDDPNELASQSASHNSTQLQVDSGEIDDRHVPF